MREERFRTLDFWYIDEIRPGIYEKVYARDQIDEDDKPCGEILSTFSEGKAVAFRDNSGHDHRCVIPFTSILFDERGW